jgi:catechol 2,3-dioxygenase-like lactoylglutathione lyase family enzyme
MKETADFYLDRLGFRLSDRVPQFGDFMRCSGSLDHHNLFLLQQGERAGFNHAAFEVTNFDEVIVGGKFMLGRDWKPATTPGRHVMGSNLFWYFESPCGGNTEYFTDMDLMDDNWKPRVWDKHPGFAFWMMDMPSRPPAEGKPDPGSRFGAVDRDVLGPRVP